LIINQGYKNYKSDIVKSEKYKKANKFQQDLLYLDNLCANTFPNIDSVFPQHKRTAIVDSLMNLLTDKQVNQQIFSGYLYLYLSHFENQHTRLEKSGLQSKMLFPYILYFINDDWFLININQEYDSLLIGKKVIEINNKTIEKIEKSLSQYVFAENDICKRKEINKFINRPDLLRQWGIIDQTDSVSISFETGEKIWVKSISKDSDIHFHLSENQFIPNPITKYVKHHYNIALYPNENYAYFQYNKCFDQIDVNETMHEYLKPWIVPFAKMFMNHNIKKKNAKKIRGYVDVDRPIFKDYLRVMFDSIQRQGIGNLIIDLRNNGGGSSLLCTQLLYYLTEKEDLKDFSNMYYPSDYQRQIDFAKYKRFMKSYQLKTKANPEKGKLYPNGFLNCDSLLFEKIEDQTSPYYIPKNRTVFKGKIIVLANFNTGSAAALFTTLLQDNNIATIIGTSVSNNPVGASSLGPFKLPKSKYTGSVAPDYLIRPNPTIGKIQIPDYWIENSVDDLLNKRDKPFEKAIELINMK
jgi:hypothetical protein